MRSHGPAIYIPLNGPGEPSIGRFFGAYLCDNCNVMSIATSVNAYAHMIPPDMNYLLESAQEINWLPVKALGKAFPDVPEQVAAAANEAHECLSIGANRAAVMLARSVIEATAKEKGIEKGLLYNKIEALEEAGHIRPHVKDGAHEVRHLGNDMAHGDFVEAVDIADADLVLALMDEVLSEVFQSPAKVQAAQAARLARQRPAGH